MGMVTGAVMGPCGGLWNRSRPRTVHQGAGGGSLHWTEVVKRYIYICNDRVFCVFHDQSTQTTQPGGSRWLYSAHRLHGKLDCVTPKSIRYSRSLETRHNRGGLSAENCASKCMHPLAEAARSMAVLIFAAGWMAAGVMAEAVCHRSALLL